MIKSVVYRASEIGCEVLGIRRGWEGLTHVDLKDPASRSRYIQPLNRENTRTIDRTGGTYLHTSRTNPTKMQKLPPTLAGQRFSSKESTKKGVTSTVFDVTPAVLKNIEMLGFDYLVAIGGDDTLSYAAELDRQGVKVIAVPKTMDNDVRNTEYRNRAFDRHYSVLWTPSNGSGPRLARTSASASFACSAGYMPATTALYTAYVKPIALLHSRVQGGFEAPDRTPDSRQTQQSQQLLTGDSSLRAPSGKAIRQKEYGPASGRLRPLQEDERR